MSSDEDETTSTSSSSEEEEEGFRNKKKGSNKLKLKGISTDKHKNKKKKKDKGKKHKKKESKHSKKSKKRRRRDSSSDSSGSSSGGSSDEEEDQWVEVGAVVESKSKKKKNKKGEAGPSASKEKETVEGPAASSASADPLRPPGDDDEEEWAGFGNILPTYSNDSKREKRRKAKEEERMANSIDRAGQTDKELNPYWKDGGKGLPSEEKASDKPKAMGAVGDGGLAWLKKSFARAKQQAEDDGRSLEEVVAERWGSIETFYTLLEEAENKARGESTDNKSRRRDRDDDDRGRRRFHRPDDSDEDNRSSRRRDDRDRDRDRDRRHHRDRHRRSRDRSHSRERGQSWRKPGFQKKEEERPRSKDIPVPQVIVTQKPPPSPPHEVMDTEEPEEQEETTPAPKVLTDKEMNELNAKIFKAELLGDAETISALKEKLSDAQKAREEYIKSGNVPGAETGPKVVTKVILGSQQRKGRDKITESHKEGQRVRYFPDDDKYDLKRMFEKEKLNTVEDENAMFSRLISKRSKATEDYDVDDIFVDRASSSKQAAKEEKREVEKVLYEEKAYNLVLDGCSWCFEGRKLEKHLIVTIGKTCFLAVPPYQSLTEGHCLIVPMSHVTCATQLDEDVWSEVQEFKKALARMFFQQEEDVVFYEQAVFLKRQPHMYIECVSMPKETGELAPIYFKKAIQECETEWAQNKKVVDLKGRDVRRAVPKGLPYFSVEFGDDSSCGFAHVIEDEQAFPSNFAQEIIGGMLELDHQIWRKRKRDDFNTQRDKLMKFLRMWEPFDFTKKE